MGTQFSEDEAHALLGLEFEPATPYLGIPLATRGKVIGCHWLSGQWQIQIAWHDAPHRVMPESFTKEAIGLLIRRCSSGEAGQPFSPLAANP